MDTLWWGGGGCGGPRDVQCPRRPKEKPSETKREKQVFPILPSFLPSCTNTYSTYYALHLMEVFDKCQISKISRQVKAEPLLGPGKRNPNFKGCHTQQGSHSGCPLAASLPLGSRGHAYWEPVPTPHTDHALGVEDLKIPCLNNPEPVPA